MRIKAETVAPQIRLRTLPCSLLTLILSCIGLELELLVSTDWLAVGPGGSPAASSSLGKRAFGNNASHHAGLSLRCKNQLCCSYWLTLTCVLADMLAPQIRLRTLSCFSLTLLLSCCSLELKLLVLTDWLAVESDSEDGSSSDCNSSSSVDSTKVGGVSAMQSHVHGELHCLSFNLGDVYVLTWQQVEAPSVAVRKRKIDMEPWFPIQKILMLGYLYVFIYLEILFPV
jgi:hypothetical protein